MEGKRALDKSLLETKSEKTLVKEFIDEDKIRKMTRMNWLHQNHKLMKKTNNFQVFENIAWERNENSLKTDTYYLDSKASTSFSKMK